MLVWCVIVAAGSGTRFGGPKQFEQVAGLSVLQHSINAFAGLVDGLVLVMNPEHNAQINDVDQIVSGGLTRSDSVSNGLAAVPDNVDFVLVHDAARPLASSVLISRVISSLKNGSDAVVPVVPVSDSLRTVDGDYVDRAGFVAVQTPQGFKRKVLVDSYSSGRVATDDATLVADLGFVVDHVEGESINIKVTYPEDIKVCEALLCS